MNEADKIRAAVETEREACAMICEHMAEVWGSNGGDEGEFGPRSAEDAADAIRERGGNGGWQPIETAPKDGTWILLCGGGPDKYDWDGRTMPFCSSAQWTHHLNGEELEEGRWQFAWYDGGFHGEYEKPTHWMPLPAPPNTKGE